MKLLLTLSLALPLMAQLPAPNTTGVAMGHLHLKSKDAAGNRKFWVDTLGGTPAKVGPIEFYKFPDVLVMITAGEHKGGSEGSAINHLGFKVKNLDAYIEKCKADGWEIAKINMETRQLFVMSPDKIKVELSEDKTMKVPIAHHHIHWSTVSIADTKAWYVKMFGAVPGTRLSFEAADVPGANLTFSKYDDAPSPTKGRAMDHIGFEIKDLEAFTKRMESMGVKFDVPFRKVPSLGISIAFFTDPWGTYVELTEGLDKF